MIKNKYKLLLALATLGCGTVIAQEDILATEPVGQTTPTDPTETDLEKTNQLAEEYRQQEAVVNQTTQQIADKENELANVQSQLSTIDQEITAQQNTVNNLTAKETQAQNALNQANTQLNNAQNEYNVANTAYNQAKTLYNNSPSNAVNPTDPHRQSAIGFFEWLNQKGVYESDVAIQILNQHIDKFQLGIYQDVTSLEQMKKAIALIKDGNALRVKEGVQALRVSPQLMAIAMVQTTASIDTMTHSYLYNVGENLAWGLSDPYYGWYTLEKENYIAIQQGKEPTHLNGQTGHYKNLIKPTYNITGFARAYFEWVGWSPADGQTFLTTNGDLSRYLTVEAFESLFLQYYNQNKPTVSVKTGLDNAKKRLDTAKTSLTNAQQNVKTKQNAYDQAKINTQNAKTKLIQLQETCQSLPAQQSFLFAHLNSLKETLVKQESALTLVRTKLELYKPYTKYTTTQMKAGISYNADGTTTQLYRDVTLYDFHFTGVDKAEYDNQLHVFIGGVVAPKATGSYKYKDTYVTVTDGVINPQSGVVNDNDVYKLVKNGNVDSSFTGLAKVDNGSWYYFNKGIHDKTFTGVSKSNVSNSLFAVRSGILDWNYTGILKNPNNGKWMFVRKGKHDSAFTGFAKSAANGKWYFARKGILDWSFTGVAKSVENGKWYHAKKGQLDWGFTGFSKSVADGRWYFSRKGKLDWGFTGVAKSVTNGKWYFARNGRLDWGFTGVGKSVSNGKWYSVYRGKLNWYYNGGAVSSSNGRWYAVQRGQLNWNYTGWMRCHDGLFRYFYRGVA